jgi:hypothetical protein
MLSRLKEDAHADRDNDIRTGLDRLAGGYLLMDQAQKMLGQKST